MQYSRPWKMEPSSSARKKEKREVYIASKIQVHLFLFLFHPRRPVWQGGGLKGVLSSVSCSFRKSRSCVSCCLFVDQLYQGESLLGFGPLCACYFSSRIGERWKKKRKKRDTYWRRSGQRTSQGRRIWPWPGSAWWGRVWRKGQKETLCW